MDDIPQVFLVAQRTFTDRVHAITEEQWSAPTPDTEWSVADLVDHLIDEHRWFPPLLHGLDLGAAGEVVQGARRLPVDGGVGANLAELWDEAATASADAAIDPGAMDRSVELSRGDTPARQYALEMAIDLIVHAWDLGKAIGYDEPLPSELVDFGYEQARDWGDISDSGYFGAPVSVPDDASQEDKLVALTGRDPNWAPS
jgi:uncharacterized protein (TIGR03086 family)